MSESAHGKDWCCRGWRIIFWWPQASFAFLFYQFEKNSYYLFSYICKVNCGSCCYEYRMNVCRVKVAAPNQMEFPRWRVFDIPGDYLQEAPHSSFSTLAIIIILFTVLKKKTGLTAFECSLIEGTCWGLQDNVRHDPFDLEAQVEVRPVQTRLLSCVTLLFAANALWTLSSSSSSLC